MKYRCVSLPEHNRNLQSEIKNRKVFEYLCRLISQKFLIKFLPNGELKNLKLPEYSRDYDINYDSNGPLLTILESSDCKNADTIKIIW